MNGFEQRDRLSGESPSVAAEATYAIFGPDTTLVRRRVARGRAGSSVSTTFYTISWIALGMSGAVAVWQAAQTDGMTDGFLLFFCWGLILSVTSLLVAWMLTAATFGLVEAWDRSSRAWIGRSGHYLTLDEVHAWREHWHGNHAERQRQHYSDVKSQLLSGAQIWVKD